MTDLTTRATQGYFGSATDRIVAIATQGLFDEVMEGQLLILTIDITGRKSPIRITKRNSGDIEQKRSSRIRIDS